MVDQTLIYRKLADLQEYIQQIEEYQSVTVEQYRSDWKIQRIVERTLQMMIESCIDIANHVIADKQWGSPENYAEAFSILAAYHVLPSELSVQLERMARFRNLIVHQYLSIHAETVVQILRERIGDLQEYRQYIVRFME